MSKTFLISVVTALLLSTAIYAVIFEKYKIQQKPTIIIASSIPLSRAPKDIIRSAELAFNKYSKQVTFANLVLDIRDDTSATGRGSDEATLRRNAQEFSEDPRVVAYFGPTYSLAAKIILPTLNQANLPTLSPTCSLPSLTRSGFAIDEPSKYQPTHRRNFVRLSTTDDTDSYNAALWVKELGMKTVAVIDDQSLDYSSTLLYTTHFQDAGITITGRHVLTGSSTQNIVKEIIKQNPDIVYYQGISDTLITSFIRELRKANYRGALMSEDTAIAKVDTKSIASLVEGMYITSLSIPLDQVDNPRARSFEESYERAYGEKPTSVGGLAYDGMKILIDAIAQSNGTRESINTILLSTKNYPTIFGYASFDSNGDNSGTIVGRGVMRSGRVEFERFVERSELFSD